MATLNDVQKVFSKYSIEILIYKFFRMIRSDSARGYAEYGCVSYCQFIKLAKIEKKKEGGLFKGSRDYFAIKGVFDKLFIEFRYEEYSKPLTLSNLVIDILTDNSDSDNFKNYVLLIDGKIVCDFSTQRSISEINSFHFGEWIKYLESQIEIHDNEIVEESREQRNKKYNSNLNDDLFTLIKDDKLLETFENKKILVIKDINLKKISIKKKLIKKDSVLINEFIKGDRNKSLIISLMGTLTKKNIEVKGEGVKYMVSWNHGKRKIILNKIEAISYIENKINKKSEIN